MMTEPRRLRVLWVCAHRTHRYEEVGALLKAGAEVIPISSLNTDFPNAVDPEEASDPFYPEWRKNSTVPRADAERIRRIDFLRESRSLSQSDRALVNQYIDVCFVASFSKVVRDMLHWFEGHIVLRAFGGYPYSQVLEPWNFAGHRDLNMIGHNGRFSWCPILPYLREIEDERITQNEVIVPAFVSASRISARWLGADSVPSVVEVISLIEKYRSDVYRSYVDAFGTLPLMILGANEKSGALADDERVVGSLNDDDYFSAIAAARVMLYVGLRSKYHLHYHPLEAFAIGTPVVFLSSSSIAHHARYYGFSDDALTAMGMVESDEEALRLAGRCLESSEFAVELSRKQQALREEFGPARGEAVIARLVDELSHRKRYHSAYGRKIGRRQGVPLRWWSSKGLRALVYARLTG